MVIFLQASFPTVAYDPLLGVRPGHCGVPLTLQFLGSWGGNCYHCRSSYPPGTVRNAFGVALTLVKPTPVQT